MDILPAELWKHEIHDFLPNPGLYDLDLALQNIDINDPRTVVETMYRVFMKEDRTPMPPIMDDRDEWHAPRGPAIIWHHDDAATRSRAGNCESVVVVSTHRGEITDPRFLARLPKTVSVTLIMPWVTRIGHDCLMGCPRLQSVSFVGMASLVGIGDYWMGACPLLSTVAFDGLGVLEEVGDAWMWNCDGLVRTPGFGGLHSLRTVGKHWLQDCVSLAEADFGGLYALRHVQDGWMENCGSLANTDFSGLRALRAVGDSWMNGCSALTQLNFDGMMSLVEVGDYWLMDCALLVRPDFCGLVRLEQVGSGWMYRCSPHLDPCVEQLHTHIKSIGPGGRIDVLQALHNTADGRWADSAMAFF